MAMTFTQLCTRRGRLRLPEDNTCEIHIYRMETRKFMRAENPPTPYTKRSQSNVYAIRGRRASLKQCKKRARDHGREKIISTFILHVKNSTLLQVRQFAFKLHL
jgi:hypothetical protein